MNKKYEKQIKIDTKKNSIRGDEITVLFFGLVFFAFLLVSFFRLFAIGKLFDDFLFLFLFGWSRYLVYLFLFIIVILIFFNLYLKIKFLFLLKIFFLFFMISWLIQNITILIKDNSTNIWWRLHFYQFNELSAYFKGWWNNTIINNYHGFFAQPFSFDNWKDASAFFPSFAAGGIIANCLVFLSGYGGLSSSWILNFFFLFVGIFCLFFSKFCLLFNFIFVKLVNFYTKKKKKKYISKKSFKDKTLLDVGLNVKQEEKEQLGVILQQNENQELIEDKFESKKNYEAGDNLKAFEDKLTNQDVVKLIQEKGILTPFGVISTDKTSKFNVSDSNSEDKD